MRSRLAVSIGVLVVGVMLFGDRAQAQEHVRLMPQLGTRDITSVAFSPDGRFVLAGSWDNTARLWNTVTGQEVRSFEGHTDLISSVAFSPDGRYVLTGSNDKTARLWDTTTGQQIRSFTGTSPVAFSPDGRSVLTGGETMLLWDAATGQQIRSFLGQTSYVGSVAFSPDGRYVLTGCSGSETALLWDAATGQQIRSFAGHTSRTYSVAFSPDGRYVLTDSDDKTARLWDATTGQQIRFFAGNGSVAVTAVFSPDGRGVLTGGGETAQLWDTATGQQIRSFATHLDPVRSVAFSPDGRFVLTGGESRVDGGTTTLLWDAATGQQVRSFEGHATEVSSVAFSRDGRSLFIGSVDKTARLWDMTTGRQVRSFKGHTDTVTSVASSPDGRFLITGSADKIARLWDMTSGRQVRSFEGHTDLITSVAFSPDGGFVLTGSKDDTALMWNVTTGQKIRSFQGSDDSVIFAVAFSPDGHYLLTGGRDAVLWNAASGQKIRTFQELVGRVCSVAFSSDSKYVLTGSKDETTTLWNAATGQRIRRFLGHTGQVLSVAFSPNGDRLLTGTSDGTAQLWDIDTGRQIHFFGGHKSWSWTLAAFSPDGRFVLTGSYDTTARLWDAATGKQLATLLSFDDGGWAVADLDGRYDSNDPDDTPGLIWVTDNNRIIDLKQLKDNYYTPNLLAVIMKGEHLPDVKGLDLVPAPPEVAIDLPYKPEINSLSLSITNQGGGVGRLIVSVNDRRVLVLEDPVAEHSTSKADNGNKTKLMIDLSAATLIPGENTIKVYAFDAGNQIRSHEAITTFAVPAKAKGVTLEADDSLAADYKPQFYGIVVGTSSFPGNHAMDLQYPAHDAESMMTGLQIGAGKLFGIENIHLRLLTTDAKEDSGQPTKANVEAAFADVAKKAKPTDVFLVYLSGHGVNLRTEKDSYYYLTTDARTLDFANNPELRNLSTVSSGELRNWLGAKNMPLKEVLILDTCAAGAANEELLKLVEKRDVPPDQRRAVEFLKDATGTIILMGSAADKVSYEASKYGQGLLTYALLEGMKGRSIEDGSRLNVSHWFQNASEDVTQLAQSIGGVQKPVIAAPSGTGFPVALLDSADQARIPLAAIKPELLHLTCRDDHDHDPLGLGVVVREQLREISHPAARGQETEPKIVYFDDMNDGPADSLTPKIIYSVSGSMVTLTLRIDQADNTIKEDHLSLSITDKNALATAVAAKLVEMAGQVPLNAAKQ